VLHRPLQSVRYRILAYVSCFDESKLNEGYQLLRLVRVRSAYFLPVSLRLPCYPTKFDGVKMAYVPCKRDEWEGRGGREGGREGGKGCSVPKKEQK